MMTRLISAGIALGALVAAPAGAVDASGMARDYAELTDEEREIVEIETALEDYAALGVVEDDAVLTVGDGERAVLGSVDGPTTGMAELALDTYGCVSGVEIDFPTMGGIAGQRGIFGRAQGETGPPLGVLPFARSGDSAAVFGDLDRMEGAPDHRPLTLSGGGRGFCEGVHAIHIGLATRWDLTPGRGSGNRFAAPGVYRLPVTVTIMR